MTGCNSRKRIEPEIVEALRSVNANKRFKALLSRWETTCNLGDNL
jgi:hypothetical protein